MSIGDLNANLCKIDTIINFLIKNIFLKKLIKICWQDNKCDDNIDLLTRQQVVANIDLLTKLTGII